MAETKVQASDGNEGLLNVVCYAATSLHVASNDFSFFDTSPSLKYLAVLGLFPNYFSFNSTQGRRDRCETTTENFLLFLLLYLKKIFPRFNVFRRCYRAPTVPFFIHRFCSCLTLEFIKE